MIHLLKQDFVFDGYVSIELTRIKVTLTLVLPSFSTCLLLDTHKVHNDLVTQNIYRKHKKRTFKINWFFAERGN